MDCGREAVDLLNLKIDVEEYDTISNTEMVDGTPFIGTGQNGQWMVKSGRW